MVVAPHAAEQAVGSDPVARCFHEVRHRDAVRVGPRRFERQAAQQRAARIGQLEQGEIGRDVRDRFGDGQQEKGEAGRHQPVQRAPEPTQADLLDRPAARETQRERAGQVSCDDDQYGRVEVAPAPQRLHRQCGRDATDHAQECGGHVVEDGLQSDHHGQNHRGDHRDAAIEEHRHHHGDKGHEDDGRMVRVRPRHDPGLG